MRHKQFKLSILLLLGIAFTPMQAQNMNVKTKSGTSNAYVINETQKLTFNAGNLVVTKKDGSSSSFAISDIRNLNFNVFTGITEATQKASKLTVYPNPVQDRLNLSLTDKTSERVQIDVFSIDGKLVYTQAINSEQSENLSLNVAGWQVGMYFIRINNGIESVTTKFTKN